MNQQLLHCLRTLRLSGLVSSLELRLQEASSHGLSHAQFLELILQDELNARGQRLIDKRRKDAGFRDQRTLEDFDWAFNASLKRPQFYQLATAAFVRERRDLLFLGPPGLGKSHLAQAIGIHVIKAGFSVLYRSIFELIRELQAERSQADHDRLLDRYLKVDLLIIDDMGLKTLPAKAGEVLLELVMRRYESRSTLMTSNRPIEEWGKLLNDVAAASAILDRFLHHAEIVQFTGKSYRVDQAARRRKGEEKSGLTAGGRR